MSGRTCSSPTLARTRMGLCVHAEACAELARDLGGARTRPEQVRMLACDTCELYDETHCPLALAGTARCKGLRGD